MAVYIKRALEADGDRDRDSALDEGIVAWGSQFIQVLRYLAGQQETLRPLTERGLDRFVRWLGGLTLSRRADEAERRALAALEVSSALPRLTVASLSGLPPEHPLRRAHLGPAIRALYQWLDDARQEGVPAEEILPTLGTLIMVEEDDARRREVLEEGLAILESEPDEEARDFRIAAADVLMGRAIEERDGGNARAQRELAARGRRVVAPLVAEKAVQADPPGLVLGALLAEVEGDAEAAFVLYERALAADLNESQRAGALSGLLRTGVLTGRHEAVVSRGSAMLDLLLQRYVTADDEVDRHAGDLQRAVRRITGSCVALGDFRQLLLTLERTSSTRLRHRSLLRQGRRSRHIRRLEAALWSAQRGAPVEAGAAKLAVADGRAAQTVTLQARLQEAYREAAYQLADRFDPLEPEKVSRRLRTDEGIVVLAAGSWGTALLFLWRSEPLSGQILPSELDAWDSAIVQESTGWGHVVGAPWDYRGDARADLDRLLSHAEDAVGHPLADWARRHGIRRLWVVAHGVLAYVPWWAVPSLRELDVRTAPTLHLFPRRRGVASLSGLSVIVADPTGDLPVARAEASQVRAHLREAGIAAEQLVEGQATEHTIAAMLSGARILHFSGHGMSHLTEPSLSALHAHPDNGFAGQAGAALIEELAARADWQAGADGLREAELNLSVAGPTQTVRLVEETLAGDMVLRHLEHGPTGTLLAVYAGGRRIHLAELWSAGDMAVSGALRGVRLAVLSACQTGGGGLGWGPDEFAGLPAALTLAGVRTVVCTAWKVDDALAALAVDLLWEELCRDPGRTVDVAATVSELRRRLASMPKAEAVARLEGLRSTAPTPRGRFLLEARQARIREGPPCPFAHPYDWAPLFVLGEPLVTWRTR